MPPKCEMSNPYVSQSGKRTGVVASTRLGSETSGALIGCGVAREGSFAMLDMVDWLWDVLKRPRPKIPIEKQ
jgi:hypothetical protein